MVSLACIALSTDTSKASSSNSYADIAEHAIKGVVNIRATVASNQTRQKQDPYEFFLKSPKPFGGSGQSYVMGSGTILDDKGHILTNHHVIKGATRIDVLFADTRQQVQAKLVGSDPDTDLALLAALPPRGSVKPLLFGNSELLRIGDKVLAVGNPFGYAHTVTSGIISAKGRVLGTGPYDNFLQTDAAIHIGNSGGPLVDMQGRVVGITTATQEGSFGIGFAIPSNQAVEVSRQLLRHGRIIRPWMGVAGHSIFSRDEWGGMHEDPDGLYGVRITNIVQDSPAHRAGLQINDLILNFDRKKVDDLHALRRLLQEKSSADHVVLRIYRRGRGFRQIRITLVPSPANNALSGQNLVF